MRSNPLELEIKNVSIPVGVTFRQYVDGLKGAIRSGRLPSGWKVDIAWRNPETKNGRSKNWQQGEWGEVLEASSQGFATALRNVLKEAEPPPLTKAELRSEAAKRGAATRKVQKERTEALKKAKARSDAAKKGAATKAKAKARKRKLI